MDIDAQMKRTSDRLDAIENTLRGLGLGREVIRPAEEGAQAPGDRMQAFEDRLSGLERALDVKGPFMARLDEFAANLRDADIKIHQRLDEMQRAHDAGLQRVAGVENRLPPVERPAGEVGTQGGEAGLQHMEQQGGAQPGGNPGVVSGTTDPNVALGASGTADGRPGRPTPTGHTAKDLDDAPNDAERRVPRPA